jgi:hypothetical protein
MKTLGRLVFGLGLLSSVVTSATCFINVSERCSDLLTGGVRPDYAGVACAQSNNGHGTCSDVAQLDPTVTHSQTAGYYVPGKQKRIVQDCTVTWDDWVCTEEGPNGNCVPDFLGRTRNASHAPIDPTSLGCVRYPAPGGGGDL